MKSNFTLSIWVLSLIIFSCKNIESDKLNPAQKEDNQSHYPKNEPRSNSNKDSLISTKFKNKPEKIRPERFYVSANSGLNFRNSPDGKILGKFPLNTKLSVVQHTNMFQEIHDGNESLKGEWVGVENKKETVFVFSAYLSPHPTYSDLTIFYANPCDQKNNMNRPGFISLTGSYWPWENGKEGIIPAKNIGQDNIELSQKKKLEFLGKLDISESHKAFIFNLELDSLFVYSIENLPLIAKINTYSISSDNISEHDYEIGLGLGENYCAKGDNLSYLGKENIFQIAKIEPIIWEKIDSLLPSESIPRNKIKETYKFTTGNLNYFIQNFVGHSNQISGRLFSVYDKERKSMIYEKQYKSSEGIYLMPLNIKNEYSGYGPQWTGKIFKGKPPIAFGFVSHSFDCPKIDFIDNGEPPIIISCDNRH